MTLLLLTFACAHPVQPVAISDIRASDEMLEDPSDDRASDLPEESSTCADDEPCEDEP